MADLTIWCAPIGGRFPGDSTAQPVMAFPGVSGGISRTLTGLATSTQSIAMPDFGSRYSFVTLVASSPEWTVSLGWGTDPDTQETTTTYGVSPTNG